MQVRNLLRSLPAPAVDETIDQLVSRGDLRIERIVSHGHVSGADFWYEQADNEWVLLLCGSARLRFADAAGDVELGAGDCLLIPAGIRHRVTRTSSQPPAVWLAVFYPP